MLSLTGPGIPGTVRTRPFAEFFNAEQASQVYDVLKERTVWALLGKDDDWNPDEERPAA